MTSQTQIKVQPGEQRSLERSSVYPAVNELREEISLFSCASNQERQHVSNPRKMRGELAVKAIIFYDDFFAAVKAKAALQNSVQDVDFAMQWDIQAWRLDLLKFPPAAEEALTDARDAHLIVFAGSTAQSIPHWLRTWLEHWVKCRQVEEAALAVSGVADSIRVLSFAESDLARFAERHSLNFIFGDDCEFESAPEIMVDLKNDLELADPTNTQLAEGAAQRGLIRAWGINE